MTPPMQDDLGRHRTQRAGAVFADASGTRLRLARRLTYLLVGAGALAMAAALISLFAGVPLASFRPPVGLPNSAHASKHAPTQAREDPAAPSALPKLADPALSTQPSSGASTGSSPPSSAVRVVSAPLSTAGVTRPSLSAPVSATPGTSSLAVPSASPSTTAPGTAASTHGQGPKNTPPGHTKSPGR
jgi:hypothetical protein